MGKLSHTPIVANSEQQTTRKRRKGSSETPSANALRERVRAQNMKKAYLKLQKTLPQVPPDTKLPRLNILLLAIDYISHLRCVLRSEAKPKRSLPNLRNKSGMLRPFIEKWPIRSQLLSDFLRPQVNGTQVKQAITAKDK
ncbi:PREDICTED: transcription factor 24-like [Acropora digitifera]|uniref:transcription factor 24-like n=1 Tax=Acropora digitifera TaxID=70779 RepID=UPI00077A8BFD|nr:PREDICTED: transcription factor 24-like [Acropora digitifera]